MSRKRIIITALTVILGTVLVAVGGYHLLMYVVLPGLFGPSDIPEDEKIVEFDDGTVLERTGGRTYTHTLFDGYSFMRSDTKFECQFHSDSSGWISE